MKRIAILLLTLFGSATVLWAQVPAIPASTMIAAAATPDNDSTSVRLLVGRSTVLDVAGAVSRVSLTSSDIADALVTSPSQLLIHGKMPGTISMFVWERGGGVRRYEVTVQRDLTRLAEQVRELFPGEKIDVQSNGKNIVLSGTVSNKDLIDKAVSVASGYVDKREEIVSLLQQQAGGPSNQVLLRVRFAEVSRSALTELGLSLVANGYKNGRWLGRTSTEQFAAPEWDNQGRLVFSDFLNLFLFDSKNELGAVLKALQTKGLFQSLAEPNLVAESGKEASFLAGGEIPIPIAQPSGGGVTVTVQYKEFGIRLNFTPVVNGERVHLKVRPEVSTLDFNNAVTLSGFRIPAFSTRRAETELELNNGQTFAMAGLIDNSVRSTMTKIPGIGDIPILGYLFQSKSAQKEQTELVVMITPEILPNNSPGLTPNLPRLPEPFLQQLPEKKTVPAPPPAFGGRPAGALNADAAPAAPVKALNPAAPVETPPAQSAAATVSALTPRAPRMMQLADIASTLPATPAMNDKDKKALERARRDEEQRAREKAKADARMKAEEAKRQAAQAAADERKAAEAHDREEKAKAEESKKQAAQTAADKQSTAVEQDRQEKATREQARRDVEAARRAEEERQKQAERDRDRQKLVDQAEAKLKAAQAAYDAEVSKDKK